MVLVNGKLARLGRLSLYQKRHEPFTSFHILDILFAKEINTLLLISDGGKKKKYC